MNKTTSLCLNLLWDKSAAAGYENVYLNRITREHQQKLGEILLLSKGTRYLDAGCGSGNCFELIAQKIRPAEVYAIDWSSLMLKKAKKEAERLHQIYPGTSIVFPNVIKTRQPGFTDLTTPLAWPDNFFDGCVSNQVIGHLDCGWKKPIEELTRVIKPGGYLYLGTILKHWGFTKVIWMHLLPEIFLQHPSISLQGLKHRHILNRISKEAKARGAEYPDSIELTYLLKSLHFVEIKTIPTYWGGCLIIRARLDKT